MSRPLVRVPGPLLAQPGQVHPWIVFLLGLLAEAKYQVVVIMALPSLLAAVLVLPLLSVNAAIDANKQAELSREIREEFRRTGFNWMSPVHFKVCKQGHSCSEHAQQLAWWPPLPLCASLPNHAVACRADFAS